MFRVGIGRPHKRQPVIALIDDLDIRIIHANTGEKLTELTSTPPADTNPKNQKRPEPGGSGLNDVSRHHIGGRRGIRTPGTREGPIVFKTIAIVRSAILPQAILASATHDLAAKVAIRFAACGESLWRGGRVWLKAHPC